MTQRAVVSLGALLLAGCGDALRPVPEETALPRPLFESGASDVTPPALTALSFSPVAINTATGSATVTVSYSVTDDLAGFGTICAQFTPPSGSGFGNCDGATAATSHSGAITFTFPQYGEAGTWKLDIYHLVDAVGNGRLYSTADLAAAGFPTDLFVGVLDVTIDIKPGEDPNSIKPKSKGTTPVAILSTGDFDAPAEVDRTSLTFGRTGNEQSLAFCKSADDDVNGDGHADLVCRFTTQATGLQRGDSEAILKGRTVGGTPIEGRDAVRVIR
jgi:hypothetical protein